jgi:menaquinone-dependent protoporphyrinogen oxidase
MSTSILVGYATRYGSTQEVAEAVEARLRECGFEADLQTIGKVRSLEGYNAVVLGAPLYIGNWPKEALRFLEQNREGLLARSIAVFALGPLSADENELQGSRAQLEKVLAKFAWLKPCDIEVFAGKYDSKKLRFPDNLIAIFPASPLHNVPEKDVRNWTAIREWASGLSAKLLAV